MIKLLLLILLPGLVLAQPPQGQPLQEQMPAAPKGQMPTPPPFDEFKKTMSPMVEKTLPAMKETRECVSKAESKEAVEKCVNAMAQKAQEIQKQAGKPGTAVARKMPADFEWTPERKQMMLKQMDLSITRNSAMHECLGQSNTREEMDTCMRSEVPMKKIRKEVPKSPLPPTPPMPSGQ